MTGPSVSETTAVTPRKRAVRKTGAKKRRTGKTRSRSGNGAAGGAINAGVSKFTSSVFSAYTPDATAVSYDQSQVPLGAMIGVMSVPRVDGKTSVLVGVHGLLPNHHYGASVHVNPCGPTAAAAGPGYQAAADEGIRLVLRTNPHGMAISSTTIDHLFTDQRPKSVVLHACPDTEEETDQRLACANHPF